MQLKIVLAGDGGAGKITFMKHHLTCEFEKYAFTQGVEIHPLMSHFTPIGSLLTSMCGIQQARSLQVEMAITSKPSMPFIIMFDVTSRDTYNNETN